MVMGPWGFGPISIKSILRHGISAAGYTKQQIFSTLCPKLRSPKLSRRYIKSGRLRLKSMRRKPLRSSLKPIRTNIHRPPFLYRKIVKSYWPIMIFLPNIGRVYEPVTRLNPPLVPLGTEPEETMVVSIAMVCCT